MHSAKNFNQDIGKWDTYLDTISDIRSYSANISTNSGKWNTSIVENVGYMVVFQPSNYFSQVICNLGDLYSGDNVGYVVVTLSTTSTKLLASGILLLWR